MAEIIVTSSADSGDGSLRQAIAAARNGDVILFDADVFPVGQTTSILLSSLFTFTYNITIDAGEPVEYLGVVREVDGVDTIVEITPETPAQEGEHPARFLRCRVALDGQDGRRIAVVGINREPTLRGLEMTRGLGSGAILNIYGGTTTTLINCSVIRGTSAQASAAIVCSTGTQIFKNCVFALNQGRGVFWNQGDSIQTFEGCRFIANHTDANGGALQFAQQAAGEAVINNCDFIGNSANQNGGAIYTAKTKQVTLNNCNIISCSATASGGGIYSADSSQNTLNDCNISNCSANYGGGVYSSNSGQNALNNCVINACTATSGGGLYSTSASHNDLNDCILTNNTSQNFGSAVRLESSSSVAIINCEIYDNTSVNNGTTNDVSAGSTSSVSVTTSRINGVGIGAKASLHIDAGTTTCGALSLNKTGDNAAIVTIADGAMLSVSESATIPAGTPFTSDGRGYLAIPVGVDASDAILTNVVLCDYCPDKTYYYVGGSEGSFAASSDWSTAKGGAALRYAPLANGYDFVVETGENNVAITKGAEPFSGATVVLSGPATVSATVDTATFDVEAFTGSLVLTGDVAITGDASAVDVTVDGTLRVAGSQKISSLTLAEGANVAFSAANDVLAVTTLATLNNATFTCSEPNAYFAAPGGTDSASATFTNVVFGIVGAGVSNVTGTHVGENYTINIFSNDNTKPIRVEYKGESGETWTVADPAFVGTTYRIRLSEDGVTFRVYDGEKLTVAAITNYGVYNAAREAVEVGYLKTSSQAGYVN